MCYSAHMDTTIRNLNEDAYRRLKAHAALTGKTIGEAVNEAIQAYLARTQPLERRGTLRDLQPEPYPKGTEHLSEQIDQVVYGA